MCFLVVYLFNSRVSYYRNSFFYFFLWMFKQRRCENVRVNIEDNNINSRLKCQCVSDLIRRSKINYWWPLCVLLFPNSLKAFFLLLLLYWFLFWQFHRWNSFYPMFILLFDWHLLLFLLCFCKLIQSMYFLCFSVWVVNSLF